MPRPTRAYAHPIPAAAAAARILRAIRARAAQGQAWRITDYTTKPETVALVLAALRKESVC